MKNALNIDFENDRIIMTTTFKKKCSNTRSEEYELLQNVRRDYPNFTVITRHIKKNPNKKVYRGLTYDFMREYIANHTDEETAAELLTELENNIEISRCHNMAYRYPVIKKWFFEHFPEIPAFGLEEPENTEEITDAKGIIEEVNFTKEDDAA